MLSLGDSIVYGPRFEKNRDLELKKKWNRGYEFKRRVFSGREDRRKPLMSCFWQILPLI